MSALILMTHFVIKNDLDFPILLLLPPQYWDCRHEPSHAVYVVLWIGSRALHMLGNHVNDTSLAHKHPTFISALVFLSS